MPLNQPNRPKYYLAVGHADNLAPRGLHSSGLNAGGLKIPFAAHDPMKADGALASLDEKVAIPHINRRMAPEHPPTEKFSFSGKPISHKLYYGGK